ncbi:MAG: 50S ribosomal protein L11 methyltransferase [Sphingomonadales bacterium]|nr:50S ribosomal protein L11 methyltransferase [Sphingomonadales bacterium]
MPDNKDSALFGRPAQLLRMGLDLIRAGQGDKAASLAAQALAGRPDDPVVTAVAQRLGYASIPAYHHAMLGDGARSAAYRRAIEHFAPGRVVLDIGTGSGLLAMMAARAGAAHVHACEFEPRLARTAREIIAANGFADRITVHSCHSSRLDRNRDLGGGADLIVSEILAHDV